jgi:acetyl esterase/lipase
MKYPIVILFTAIISCSGSKNSSSTLTSLRLKNIVYGSFPSSKMDVALPAGRTPQTPFVIILHGGAWTLGDKGWGSRTQDSLFNHGIASVNIDYRYADNDKTHYEELLKDIDSVISFCVNRAKEWNTRKTNFIMNGESAGAHLSLMYGYTTNRKISAIIAECAPTDFTDTAMLNHYQQADPNVLQAIGKMTGAPYVKGAALPAQYFAASPVNHVKNIPTLFFHGTADQLVPYSQALTLEQKLKDKGVTYKFVPMPGAGHDVGFNTPEGRKLIYDEIVAWTWKYN